MVALGLGACSGQGVDIVPVEHVSRIQERWDSQDNNPTHATHSYLTEYAIDALAAAHPELQEFRAEIVDGANRELHDLVVKDAQQEALRIEAQGNNWGCARPEVFVNHALERYAAGDKAKAYWFVGILMHMVEDIGVPAHALHVIHQASPSDWDDFEVLALQSWKPRFDHVDRANPVLANPVDYIAFNGDWTINDFVAAYPGETYTRLFFPPTWLLAPQSLKTFVGDRQGKTATAATWALESAALLLAAPPSPPGSPSCTTPPAIPSTPVYDPASQLCAACNGDNGSEATLPCSTAAAPACQTGAANALVGQCTQCSATNPSLCTGTTAACNPATGACEACNGGFGDTTATRACPTAASPVCVGDGSCTIANGDNGTAAVAPCPTAATPYVEPDGSCGKCTTDADCAGATHRGPLCNAAVGACTSKCAASADCPAGAPDVAHASSTIGADLGPPTEGAAPGGGHSGCATAPGTSSSLSAMSLVVMVGLLRFRRRVRTLARWRNPRRWCSEG
jgi:MYXO-CTERM domain-containing protein